MQRFRFCFEGGWRGGSICSLSGKALSGTLHAHGGDLGAEGCKGCVCVWIQHYYCPVLNNMRHLNVNQVGCWFCLI